MKKITIKKIQFLTPAVVTYEENNIIMTCKVDVDVRGDVVRLPDDAPPEIADLFFPFLNESLRMPTNAFEAGDDVYAKANEANNDFENVRKEHVGEDDV